MKYQRQTDISNQAYSDFIGPKWWPTWAAISLILVLGRLPGFLRVALGYVFGVLFFIFAKRRKRVAKVNIWLTHKEESTKYRYKLLYSAFISAGLAVTETARAWSSRTPDLKNIEIAGQENIEKARKEGHGVIMLGGHFAPVDIVGSMLSKKVGFHQVQRKHDNPLFNLFITRARNRYSLTSIARLDLKQMVRTLREPGNVMWYAPDQDFGHKGTVFTSFLGVQTATVTATSKLAKMANAKVIPIDYQRVGLSRYKAIIHPALPIPGESPEADAEIISDWIAARVREHPDDYLWLHRRFKTRPEGEPSVY